MLLFEESRPGDQYMPLWKTLTKIVANKVAKEISEAFGQPWDRSNQRVPCNLCNRLFPAGTLTNGVCPLCWNPDLGREHSSSDHRVACNSCGKRLHPDALKEGTCVECWLARWKRETSKADGPLTLQEAYAILECSERSPVEEIKRKYRTLAKLFHPDVIQGKDLHPEFVDFAKTRFQAIGQAYDLVMASRTKGAPS
jgi:hypothetical protein